MKLIDIVLIIAIAAALILAVRSLKKHGKGCCGGGCSGECSSCRCSCRKCRNK